jgi:rhamnosyltransferase
MAIPVAQAGAVAAYVTAYRDSAAVARLVTLLAAQSHPWGKLYVVDNSPEPLHLPTVACSVEVVWRPQNVGTAGGVNYALRRAAREGFRFLWILDQDSEPGPDCLTKLVEGHVECSGRRIGIVAPLPRDLATGQPILPSEFKGYRFRGIEPPASGQPFSCDATMASGMLINLRAVASIELPSDDYFLDGHDLALCMALRRAGWEVQIDPRLDFGHRLGEPLIVQVGERTRYLPNGPPFRFYLMLRNHLHLARTCATGPRKARAIAYYAKRAFRLSWDVVEHHREQRLAKVLALWRGWIDGSLGLLQLRPWQ